MSKLKLFIENFLVYGLGGITSKIIPLIMVPIITRIMPDSSYYGISDLSNTVIYLCSALAIMGMYDAMYRMFFDKEDEEFKKDICSTALSFTLMTSVIIFAVMIIFKDFIAKWVFGGEYNYLVYITATATLIGATNSIVAAPTRMQNKRKVFLIMNTASSVFSYSISIPLLLCGYYVVALPLAGAAAALTSELIFLMLNHKWFQLKRFNIKYLKPLLAIAIPLLPNFLIYWVFNSSDKLMIANVLDSSAVGIYSVGSKLGHASQLIYTAFAGGWQFFAFSTMKEKNQVESNSRIFEYLGVISFICSSLVFALSKPIYELLFTETYWEGFIVAPYLFLAPLLQMLFQVEANQFLVVKKTWPNLFILSAGAIINVILNLVLIPIIGIEGAAIATLLGYTISDIVCTVVLCKMKLMVVSKRFLLSVLMLAMFILVWRFLIIDSIWISVIAAVIVSAVMFLLYRKDVMMLFKRRVK